MPTFCDIAGIKDYENRYRNPRLGADDRFDGISLLPTLTEKGVQKQHDHLYWEFHETDMLAVRRGNWKLVVISGKPLLYDLESDIHEDTDVAAQHPEIVKELIDIIYQEHTPSPLFHITLPER